ncbi:hypothetical protein [Aminobacter sp. HY435]|nr:hypothetical protein [Aminobacter sp. HY435]
MNTNDTKNTSAIEKAAGGREAAKGWLVMLLLVGAVLAVGYFYTH